MPVTTVNIAFQALAIAVLGGFCWMIHRYRAQAAECLKNAATFHISDETENKRMYDHFLVVAMTLGALSVGIAVVKLAAATLAQGTGTPGSWQWKVAGLAGTAGIDGLPMWVAPVAALAVTATAVGVAWAGTAVLRAAGALTLSQHFTKSILRTKKNWFATASILIVPLVAVWTGINPERDRIVAYMLIAVAVIITAMFAAHTLVGFIRQKVSVLVWFLYLCTVEIFPVCALVLAAMKNV